MKTEIKLTPIHTCRCATYTTYYIKADPKSYIASPFKYKRRRTFTTFRLNCMRNEREKLSWKLIPTISILFCPYKVIKSYWRGELALFATTSTLDIVNIVDSVHHFRE